MCLIPRDVIQPYAFRSGPGSNKPVGKPGTGGVIQRRARPCPNDCTLFDRASSSSARCTVRGARPQRQRERRARPRLAVGEDGEHRGVLLLDGTCQHEDVARLARRQHKTLLRRADIGQRLELGAEPPDLDAQPRAMRFIGVLRPERRLIISASRETSAGHACARRRASANSTGRVPSDTTRPCLRSGMMEGVHDERRRGRQRSRPPRAATDARCRARSGAPPACRGSRFALSTSAASAGIFACRAAWAARLSAARASFALSRLMAMPATTSSRTTCEAGGSGEALSSASVRSASSSCPTRRRRRASMWPAWAALARSPCCSSVARAAASVFTGQLRSRETSAISASATTHLARATASRGPNARAALRSSVFAFARSPSCAIAMPRSASDGASLRSATRFSAPSGSPASSARAAAVISESIQIPPHLLLPPRNRLVPEIVDDRQCAVRGERFRVRRSATRNDRPGKRNGEP